MCTQKTALVQVGKKLMCMNVFRTNKSLNLVDSWKDNGFIFSTPQEIIPVVVDLFFMNNYNTNDVGNIVRIL